MFNLFNRSNYTDINNVFGTGPYPTVLLPGYGQFVQAAAPRQAQVAIRITFSKASLDCSRPRNVLGAWPDKRVDPNVPIEDVTGTVKE